MKAFAVDFLDPKFRTATTVEEIKEVAKQLYEQEKTEQADAVAKARLVVFNYLIETPFTLQGRTVRVGYET